jgi:site-specific recombinase XerD
MTFTNYLQNKKLSAATVKAYSKDIEIFTSFLVAENTSTAIFTYNDILGFMQSCSTKGVTNKRLHHLLTVTRHYCNYLIYEAKRNDNPAAGVFIKGLVRKLPSNLMSKEDLEILYKQYSIQLNVDTSKKIMLGLLIYQGLKVEEIIRAQAKHIQLLEAKIFIPGTKRSNERWLNIEAIQMPLLQVYLQKNKFKEGKLFIEFIKEPLSEKNINNRLQYIFKQLKQLNSNIISAKQIRNSVITEWLRKNNLRQVQYMAGHKYVSSTERYQVNNLEDLQNELQQHHPMSWRSKDPASEAYREITKKR